ncbi:tRNA (adenosine(37)-N6)-dimethylallyltransferase MiaA [Sinomicrobium weinanense]|uniref:tRNA dimethylallyltransferase n=1 Tax=Sinomicrobium weinanense TaxID=2842200 RepID=A0A926Q5B0_9FLAO|nr:tRNA (adenosine(37)-N6)-dimethylallyltransferase MiaA [Sinomicrobium weinanense]MBC9797770.1 tRNA (adenosine(37)-N6)-dimethylallyltransferase MiaA [Sinomicrobium weinanense]MBU3122411.1 tRNA (adenosine(37)-N6)-dimethylallyltransferase MiaA [Sinomicrobium weinanense]
MPRALRPEKNKYLITVVGPTAIGKTSLAIEIARHFQTEVLSSDSRQFFREMNIGTAVPAEEELATVPHHFIQHKSIFDDYSVGDFEREAMTVLNELFRNNKAVVMAGGSGLYVNAVLNGLDEFPEVAPEIREQLNRDLEEKGLASLQARLEELDPDYYKRVDRENPHRLIRALEICTGTGQPYSSFLSQKTKKRNFIPIIIGLTAERKIIYDRINRRVDIMIENGLLQEAESLFPYKHLNALQTVGYKELFEYFENRCSLEFAISEIKKNTRRFAKRQLTWFRKQEDITWYDHECDIREVLGDLSARIVSKR